MSAVARGPLAVLAAAALGFAACVPIPATVALSPRATGTLLREDGTPLAGERLALTVAYGDSTCASPALHAVTDSGGRFEFPAIRQRERFTVVLFERYFEYRICGGSPPEVAYQDGHLHRVPHARTLSCTRQPEEGPGRGGRVRCFARAGRRR